MPRIVLDDTRQDILDEASRLFATTGYQGTSLQRIADEIGYSKSTLLYHFNSKVEILRELIAPSAAGLAELDRRLATMSARAAQRAAAEGFIDLAVRYRAVLAVLWPAVPEVLGAAGFEEMAEHGVRLQAALAGRSTSARATVAAHAVLAGISSACSERADLSDAALREALLSFARRALSLPG